MFKFSIIIPTYNSEATLNAALQSINNQTYRNFEVLIIDGKSSDRTLDIAASFNNKINSLRVISETDKGIYDAMNKGINLAKGEFLYFLGSDDSFYNNNVLEQISILSKNLDVIYGNVYSTRFNGKYDGVYSYKKIAEQNICHQAIFLNKRVFKIIGNFNLIYKSHADWEHNIKWFYSNKLKNAYVNLIIANYADGGFSSLNFDNKFNSDKNLLLIRKGLFLLPKSYILKLVKSHVKHIINKF